MLCKQKKSSRAFTLVELLVVIAVVGVLIAMIIPAISSVRESAHRTQCQSNLKQIGLAVLQYNTHRRVYPTGRDSTKQYSTSWAFRLLPYLEQDAIYDAYQPELRVDDPANTQAMRTAVAVFICPTRGHYQTDRNFDNEDQPPQVLASAAGGDYAASAGVHFRYGTSQASQRVDGSQAGAIYTQSRIRPSQVKDGVSRTLMIGHRHVLDPVSGYVQEEMQAHDLGDTAFFAGDNPKTIFADLSQGLPQNEEVGRDYNESWFGGPHPDVTPFVFLDGHVISLSNTTTQEPLMSMSTIGDGKSFQIDDAG